MALDVAAKYVFKDFPHSSHRVILRLIGPSPARILDVGAAEGFLGRTLTAAGHTVVGVERDPVAAERATAHYAAFHVADLAGLEPLPEAPFDLVVAGDVIEHLADPAAALDRLCAQLEPGGRLVISVPNVAFLTVRLALLAGRFEYAPRGIMDATHLRFFTRRSFRALLAGSGLQVERILGVPPPLPLVAPAFARWPMRAALELAAALARLWPGPFAYQLVAEARR